MIRRAEKAAAEAGMSRRQMKTATALTAVPEEDFEEMVETDATLAEIVAAGTQRTGYRDEGKKLVAALKAHAARISGIDLDEATASLDQVQVAQVRMLLARLEGNMGRPRGLREDGRRGLDAASGLLRK